SLRLKCKRPASRRNDLAFAGSAHPSVLIRVLPIFNENSREKTLRHVIRLSLHLYERSPQVVRVTQRFVVLLQHRPQGIDQLVDLVDIPAVAQVEGWVYCS